MVVLCEKLSQFYGMFFFIREMNEPVMAFRGKTFHNYIIQYTNRVVHVFKVFLQSFVYIY